MTNLTVSTPESTFGDVITTTNNGQGFLVSEPRPVQDGLGNNSPMELSQTIANFNRESGRYFQLDGQNLTASVELLNEVSNRFLQKEYLLQDNGYITVPGLTFPLAVASLFAMQFTIYASRTNAALDGIGATTSALFVFARNIAGTIEFCGSPSGTLNNVGLTNPNYRFIESGGNILFQIQEENSASNPTIWTIDYSLLLDVG